MSRISWWLIGVVSRVLEPREREVVQGDFAEIGETGGRALLDVLGLAVRRQAALWKNWRPWLALVGIVGPAGVGLLYFSLLFRGSYDLYSWIIQNYATIDPDILEQTGLTLRRGIPRVVSCFLLLVTWSWSGGFVLASLSRGAVWLNGALICVIWLGSSMGAKPSPGGSALLFLLPFFWGMRQGLRSGVLNLRLAALLAAAMAVITGLGVSTGGWWPGGIRHSWQLFLALVLSWPAWYLLAVAILRARSTTANTSGG
ncbi:MAG: hypothetical protein ACKV22_24840 [Bryobacteraceae bacterium]